MVGRRLTACVVVNVHLLQKVKQPVHDQAWVKASVLEKKASHQLNP